MLSNSAEATFTWLGLSPKDWASTIVGLLSLLLSVLSFVRSGRSERRANAADNRSIDTAKAQIEATLRQKLFGLLNQAHDARAKFQSAINSYRLAAGTLTDPPEGFSEDIEQWLSQTNEALAALQNHISALENKVQTIEVPDDNALIDIHLLSIGRFYVMAEDLSLQAQVVRDADALRREQRAFLSSSTANSEPRGT